MKSDYSDISITAEKMNVKYLKNIKFIFNDRSHVIGVILLVKLCVTGV